MKRLQIGFFIIALLSFGLSACSPGDVKETPTPLPALEESEDVPLDEKEPLLSFDRDYTESRLTLRTARGLIWFKLYHEEANEDRKNR